MLLLYIVKYYVIFVFLELLLLITTISIDVQEKITS